MYLQRALKGQDESCIPRGHIRDLSKHALSNSMVPGIAAKERFADCWDFSCGRCASATEQFPTTCTSTRLSLPATLIAALRWPRGLACACIAFCTATSGMRFVVGSSSPVRGDVIGWRRCRHLFSNSSSTEVHACKFCCVHANENLRLTSTLLGGLSDHIRTKQQGYTNMGKRYWSHPHCSSKSLNSTPLNWTDSHADSMAPLSVLCVSPELCLGLRTRSCHTKPEAFVTTNTRCPYTWCHETDSAP